jgi:hypothetical protein
LSCAEVRNASAEFALDILPSPPRDGVAAHLIACEACCREVDALSRLARMLLGVIPDTEPPLGFDRRVLAAARPRRHRIRTALIAPTAIAASLVAAAIGVGLTGGLGPGNAPGGRSSPARLVSALREGPNVVGSLTVAGRPPWVSVTVKGLAVSGPVTCELVAPNGADATVGTFDLVRGSGSWAAPTSQVTRDVGARLVDRAGQVVAAATF